MGWERRFARQYYYESHRVGGRTVKRYLGRGAAALAAAEQATQERARRLADSDRARQLMHTLAPLHSTSDRFDRDAAILFEACLLAAGFGRDHTGKWRPRRARPQFA